MTAHPIELIEQIPLPTQSIKKLSFCSSYKPQRVAEWASLLRPTQFNQTGVMLYHALPEVNQLKSNPHARFEILEHLRPYVQNTIFGLSKQFLHQPIALPQEAQKSAIVAQALQKNMVDGYILTARDALKAKKSKAAPEDFVAVSLHRAITGIGLLFMRSYQIYTQPPRGLWLTLHRLFRVADSYDLLDRRVTDENQAHTKVTSVEKAYLRIILLATSRPHQLNQNDLRAIYDAFAEWADYVRFSLDLSDDPDCFYYVNLERDTGPLYKSRAIEDETENLRVELKLNALLSQLTKQTHKSVEEVTPSALKVSKELSKAVLPHLLEAWGNVSQRKQERKQAQITAELCVGLSDCHYYLCNGQNFESFLKSSGSSADIQNTAESGFTPIESFGKSSPPTSNERPTQRVEVQNVSQGGYCLLWQSDSPLKVQSGDIVGVKEFGKRLWTIGVVRWIRQRKKASQLGVQILSDSAQPYALAQAYDMGGYSDFMRSLFVPSSQFTDIPATLITSSAPFHTMDRVKILDGDQEYSGKLDEQLFATGSVQQFSFRKTGNDKPKETSGAKSDW